MIVCLGEILIDQVVAVDGRRQNFPGGAPANVAIALAKLGIPSAFVGAVGDDQWGRGLTQLLATVGVNCMGLQTVSHPTRIVEVRTTNQGDRVFGGFQGGDTTEFADAYLAASQLPTGLLRSATALITGTLGLAYPSTRAAIEQAAAIVQAQAGQLVVDVNWRPTFWPQPKAATAILESWLQRVDWLKFAHDEAIALFGTADPAQLAIRFPRAQIVVTAGATGCCHAIAGGGSVPAFKVAVQETTGAGDAFLAGWLYQLSKHNWQVTDAVTVASMLTFANAMGALTTLKSGAIAAQPTPAVLSAFLSQQTGKSWTL